MSMVANPKVRHLQLTYVEAPEVMMITDGDVCLWNQWPFGTDRKGREQELPGLQCQRQTVRLEP